MKTIEVYKTNVVNNGQSLLIIQVLRQRFPTYTANFDLQDCDKILRVESNSMHISDENIIGLLNEFGYFAQPLPD